MVRYADHLIGRAVAALDELGLRENTVVMLTTDNGSTSGVDGRAWGLTIPGGKGKLTESGIDVPLIVSWPGKIAGGAKRDELVDFTDILPTLLDFAGVPLPTDRVFDGRSFAPLLLGKPYTPREWIFAQYAELRLVRDHRYKLYSDGRLFDVEKDRLETTDLAGNPEAAPARERLQAVLDGLPEDVPLPFEPRSISYRKAMGQE
jgi:arylsulfatase A